MIIEISESRQGGGETVPLGPYRDPYTVVGLTRGMVSSGGDPLGWVTLLVAQAPQFAVPPALQRREQASGRNPPTTSDTNAVLVQLEPEASATAVARDIARWKHLAAVPEGEEERYLTSFVIQKMQQQLGMFMGILTTVSAVIITLIIYTLTMDELRSIATLKFSGTPVLVVTHDESIFDRFDRLISMRDGRIEGEESRARAGPASQGTMLEVPTASFRRVTPACHGRQ